MDEKRWTGKCPAKHEVESKVRDIIKGFRVYTR